MDRYRKAFFVSAFSISIPWCFTLLFSLFSFSFQGLIVGSQFIISWLALYFYLGTKAKPAFWFSFVLVNLYWWSFLFRTIRTILNWNKYIGTEDSDKYLSLMFSGYGLLGAISLIPLTFALVFGLLIIRDIYKSSKLDKNSGLESPQTAMQDNMLFFK